jgi:hypothetical protein
MVDNSRLGSATAAAVEYVRHFGSLLFAHIEQFYEMHMEKAQMRLAPTSRAGAPRRLRPPPRET